jgi:hypothetical protein
MQDGVTTKNHGRMTQDKGSQLTQRVPLAAHKGNNNLGRPITFSSREP